MDLKRDLVKYVRDKAKSKYKKDTQCYICGSTENLDFHHFYGLTELLESWMKEQFIEEMKNEVYEHAVTLCHTHHLRLHGIYGKRPKLITAKKQQHWVNVQRDKYGMV